MKVFLSWSGDRSRLLAEALRTWMPAVIQAVKPYFTPNDIAKGARWTAEISRELEASTVGLLCITSENLDAPWVMFEAGALSRNLDKSCVCPILFGVNPTDIKGPLLQFQAASFNRNEIRRVMLTINRQLAALPSDVFDNVFEMWWPRLEDRVTSILSERSKAKTIDPRSERDMLEEILSLGRITVNRLRHGLSESARLQIIPHTNYWPPLLRKALELLFSLRDEVNKMEISSPGFVDAFREMTRQRGVLGARELQVSVVSGTRTYLYHDWPELIGTKASYSGADGVDIYDDVFRHPSGAVAWRDGSSNVQSLEPILARFNIALFTLCGEDECRLVVEAHEEIAGTTP